MKAYYEHAGIVIYHGDCLELLPHLPVEWYSSMSILVTDPPYTAAGGSTNGRTADRPANRPTLLSRPTPLRGWLLSRQSDS
jgi:DNA modification methylase